MNLKELISKSHENSVNKGFWDKYDKILNSIYNDERLNNDDFEHVKQLFITQKLMLIVSELGESLESIRNNKLLSKLDKNIDNLTDEDFIKYFKSNIKDTLEDELADVFIRLGDLCGKFDIDIEKHIELKQRYNETRDKMHGKNF